MQEWISTETSVINMEEEVKNIFFLFFLSLLQHSCQEAAVTPAVRSTEEREPSVNQSPEQSETSSPAGRAAW